LRHFQAQFIEFVFPVALLFGKKYFYSQGSGGGTADQR
jgi:hypothetical protein